MTAIERAFLDDIAAHPQDDFPRLAYADWLEEHGRGERAEFIRVQCELSRRWPQATPASEATYSSFPPGLRHEFPQFDKLRRREEGLLYKNAWDWAGQTIRDACIAGTHHKDALAYRRGFIASITLPRAAFLEHAADIIEAVPMLEEVRLSDVEPMSLWLGSVEGRVYFYPDDLCSRLKALSKVFEFVGQDHENRQAAETYMSRRLLAYARTLTPAH